MERWGQCIAAKLDTSSKQSISVGMLAKSMVANALDKSKDKKFEILENSDIVNIANGSQSSWKLNTFYIVKLAFYCHLN